MMEENNGKEGKTTLSRPDEQENRLIVSPNNGSSVKAASVASWFQRLYRRWWRSNRESLQRRERTENRGEREREREKGEMKGYRGSNCAYVSTSWPIQLSIGWQRRILNGTPTQITRVPYIFGSSNYALEILQLQLDNFDISIYFDIYFEFSDVMLDA